MLSSHGLCRLKLAPANECNELGLPKDLLPMIGGGMECHLCIAQVGFFDGF